VEAPGAGEEKILRRHGWRSGDVYSIAASGEAGYRGALAERQLGGGVWVGSGLEAG
jgi:hypothetical protein